MTTAEPLLAARGLCVERGGRELLRDFDLALAPGDLVHLRGANGAGKTTLLRILAGLSRYGYEGSVARREAVLFLGHQPAVKGLLTARENLAWHPAGDTEFSTERIDAALAEVGLAGYEDVPAAQLSAGQQRRVNLARLFLSERALWLLDEPFTALDAHGVAVLTARIVERVGQGGAVLLTSHQALDAGVPLRLLDLDRVEGS